MHLPCTTCLPVTQPATRGRDTRYAMSKFAESVGKDHIVYIMCLVFVWRLVIFMVSIEIVIAIFFTSFGRSSDVEPSMLRYNRTLKQCKRSGSLYTSYRNNNSSVIRDQTTFSSSNWKSDFWLLTRLEKRPRWPLNFFVFSMISR